MSPFRVAIVQAAPAIYDTAKTLDKLEKLAKEAAEGGAKLVLFPEAFIGGYPDLQNFVIIPGTPSVESREEFRNYHESAIEEFGPESERIASIAKELDIHLITGVIEREGGTLYCALFYFAPTGYLGKHRKLVPTAMERLVWGQGDGSTMPVFDTPLGKIGGAICWENYMPLYRVHLYNEGVQVYLAPSMDGSDVWLSTMKTIALEGRCFVISAVHFMKGSDYPEGHPTRAQTGDDKILFRGGSCVIDPLGNVLVAPQFNNESVIFADIDLSQIVRGKFDLDVVGHYARPDVFQLTVNTKSNKSVRKQ